MRIYIIRHGETEDNNNGIIQGSGGKGLSNIGILQAERLAGLLSIEEFDIILTSEMQRAKETAEIISSHHKGVDILVKSDLNERNYGIFNGLERSKVDKDHPSLETNSQLECRAQNIIDFLMKLGKENVMIVSHGSIGKRLINLLLRNKAVNYLKNTSLTVIETDGDSNKVVKLNDVNHLENKIVLMGGGDYRNNENREIDEFIVNKMGKRAKMVFVPFAVKNIEKREKRIESIKKSYSSLGFENFETLNEEEMSKEEMSWIVSKADILFLTGGDPKTLLETIENSGIKEDILNFKGMIIGFSAGGMILSDRCVIPGGMDDDYPNTLVLEGLGLTKQSFIPHYDESLDESLRQISKNDELYAIPDSSALFIDSLTNNIKIIGKTYLFKGGSKSDVII